jgi:hypothetical protein
LIDICMVVKTSGHPLLLLVQHAGLPELGSGSFLLSPTQSRLIVQFPLAFIDLGLTEAE